MSFWKFIFDPIIYLTTKDMDWVVASQTPFIIFILTPYILFRTRKDGKERLDLLLVYANDLYRYIAKKLGEDYEPKI